MEKLVLTCLSRDSFDVQEGRRRSQVYGSDRNLTTTQSLKVISQIALAAHNRHLVTTIILLFMGNECELVVCQ